MLCLPHPEPEHGYRGLVQYRDLFRALRYFYTHAPRVVGNSSKSSRGCRQSPSVPRRPMYGQLELDQILHLCQLLRHHPRETTAPQYDYLQVGKLPTSPAAQGDRILIWAANGKRFREKKCHPELAEGSEILVQHPGWTPWLDTLVGHPGYPERDDFRFFGFASE